MGRLEQIKTELGQINVNNLPIELGMAEARYRSLQILEKHLKDLGLWEKVKAEKPGKYIVIVNPPRSSEINIHISDHLRKLLKGT